MYINNAVGRSSVVIFIVSSLLANSHTRVLDTPNRILCVVYLLHLKYWPFHPTVYRFVNFFRVHFLSLIFSFCLKSRFFFSHSLVKLAKTPSDGNPFWLFQNASVRSTDKRLLLNPQMTAVVLFPLVRLSRDSIFNNLYLFKYKCIIQCCESCETPRISVNVFAPVIQTLSLFVVVQEATAVGLNGVRIFDFRPRTGYQWWHLSLIEQRCSVEKEQQQRRSWIHSQFWLFFFSSSGWPESK